MSFLDRIVNNLTQSPEELRAENLRQWAQSVVNAKSICDVAQRERCRVAGVVQTIRIDPTSGGSIEATIYDGTGHFTAKWLGRASLSGIKLGEGLIIEGAVGKGTDGEPVILNPEYELVPGPEHG